MFDHIGIVVGDYAKSKAFYAQALAAVGYSKLVELPGALAGGKDTAGFCHADGSDLWISPGEPGGSGLHLAIRASTRAEVDAFHRAGVAAGGTDNGAPGLRPRYHPNYYAAYVLDPDGRNVEAVCHDAA